MRWIRLTGDLTPTHQHFGGIKGATGSAIVISEFSESGESHEGRVWSNAIVDYLTQKGITDAFYSVRRVCIALRSFLPETRSAARSSLSTTTQQSGSITGGDWKTPANDRLEGLAKLQGNPTRL